MTFGGGRYILDLGLILDHFSRRAVHDDMLIGACNSM